MAQARRRVAQALLSAAVVGGVVAAAPPGAWAAPAPAAPPTAPASTAPAARASTSVDGMVLDDDGAAIVTELEQQEIAPGLKRTSFERYDPKGWLQVDVLVAELGTDALSVDYLHPGSVAGSNRPISEMVNGRGGVAGINGDFFDINNSGAPLGIGVSRDLGGLVTSPNPDRNNSVAFESSGVGRVAELFLEGAATLPGGGEVSISGVNVSAVPAGGVALYNEHWGTYTRTRGIGADTAAVEATVDAEGIVTGVGPVGEGQIAAGVQVLVGRDGAGADALRELSVGDVVDIAYGLREDAGDVAVAIGGQNGEWLMRDGEVSSDTNTDAHPRTAVGFADEGATMIMAVVDGRQATSRGLTISELAHLMQDLGAEDALNLDGGGSTTMVSRAPGSATAGVVNSPSDGAERADSNGLGLFAAAGSGHIAGYAVVPALQAEDTERVFPGLRRTLVAHGYDETFAAVDRAPGAWRSSSGAVVRVNNGVAFGVKPGEATVTALRGRARGSYDIEVLGELQHLSTDRQVVALAGADATSSLHLVGHDEHGYTAPIDAADVTVTGGDDLVEFTPGETGTFQVRAIGDSGSTQVEFEVDGRRTSVAVTVSLDSTVVADFSDAADWTSAHDRAPGGSVVPADGHDGQAGLALTYKFDQSTGTRGQYAVAPGGGIALPGQPQKVSLWAKGDGNGAWMRLQVLGADGIRTNLDGPHLVGTDWELVEIEVPSGLAFPLTLERVRLLETVASKQYTGSVVISDLRSYAAPPVDVPEIAAVEDDVIVPDGATDDDPLRVAVMSDSQFVARDPGSPIVEAARQTLREVVASSPDVLVINGDFVDEASPADFDLARTILDEELAGAGFPWYYVPGNHEIMGGDIANFEEEFGATTNTFDLDGTRFITLNSSTGRFGTDFDQVRMLREQLDSAAADPAVNGVLVFAHHPPNDPLPTDASQLADRHEAAMYQDWLEEFTEVSGKPAASVNSHVGVFHASTHDGVTYLVNGNSGKGPASTPDKGGFTGWSMLGVDAAREPMDWLAVETQVRAESVSVATPGPMAVGASVELAAEVLQDDTRVVPVAWPVSASWHGGAGVEVSEGEPGGVAGAIAHLNPRTGVLTALGAGAVTVGVTVNGVKGEAEVTIT